MSSNIKPEIVAMMKAHIASGKFPKAGLSQADHTALVRDAICESIFTDYSADAIDTAPDEEAKVAIRKVRAELYALLYPLGNISAVRQKFESLGVLTKSDGGKKAADAEALAKKYE